MALTEALLDGLGDFFGDLLYIIFVVPFAAIAEWARRIHNQANENDERLKRVETQLLGDDDDPNSPGALQEIHDMSAKLDGLESKLDENRQERKEEHREVSGKLDRLTNEIEE